MSNSSFRAAFLAALPIMFGYVPLGFACGILSAKAGLLPAQVLLLSAVLYAGGAQFMIANMSLSGVSPISMAASVALMNARHILYSSAAASHCPGIRPKTALLYGAEITDESFGVNHEKFAEGNWNIPNARRVNALAHLSWLVANMAGVYAGMLITLPLPVVAFSMTSMFLCLLCMQKFDGKSAVSAGFAVLGVIVCKVLGLSQAAVLAGAVLGIAAGVLWPKKEVRHELA